MSRQGDRGQPRQPDQPATPPVTDYPYVWWWRVRLPDRKGQRCRVTARGSLNSVHVEFPDGFWAITSRCAVRREVAATPPGISTG